MTAVATTTDNLNNLRSLLLRSEKQLAAALPAHIKPAHMIRVALTAVQTTPGLLDCTPLSVLGGVMKAAELGLELSGPLGQAYLIPRKNKKTRSQEATFQIGYKGMIDLCYRSGMVASVQARAVYRGDEFSYRLGTRAAIKHLPCENPGPWEHVYAVINMRGGGYDFEVMSKAQVHAHRDRYSDGWQSPYSGWQTAEEAMALKTVIRRLLKRAPVSIEARQAIAAEEAPVEVEDMAPALPASRSEALALALQQQSEGGDPPGPSDEVLCQQVPPGE